MTLDAIIHDRAAQQGMEEWAEPEPPAPYIHPSDPIIRLAQQRMNEIDRELMESR